MFIMNPKQPRWKIHLRKYQYHYKCGLLAFSLCMLITLNWDVQFGGYTLGIWFLDKFSTALTILLVAYIAQQIFNKNAKAREDRERRLAALYRVMNSLHEIEDMAKELYNPNFSISDLLVPAKKELKNIHITLLLHKIPLQKCHHKLESALKQSVPHIPLRHEINPEFDSSEKEKLHRILNYLKNVLDPAISEFKTKVIKQFKTIEINH